MPACVARNGSGVLLCGRAGAGKSTLSLCLRPRRLDLASRTTAPGCCRIRRIGWRSDARARRASASDAPSLFPELEGTSLAGASDRQNLDRGAAQRVAGIRTARRAPIGRIVFLERGRAASRGWRRISGEEAVDRILADMPSYGRRSGAMHERTVRRLAEVPRLSALRTTQRSWMEHCRVASSACATSYRAIMRQPHFFF